MRVCVCVYIYIHGHTCRVREEAHNMSVLEIGVFCVCCVYCVYLVCVLCVSLVCPFVCNFVRFLCVVWVHVYLTMSS